MNIFLNTYPVILKEPIAGYNEGTLLWARVTDNFIINIYAEKNSQTCLKSSAEKGVDFDWAEPKNNPDQHIKDIKKTIKNLPPLPRNFFPKL